MSTSEPTEPKLRHILRIVKTDIDGTKPIIHALTSIKGIGLSLARVITAKAGLEPNLRAGYLTEQQVAKIEDILKDPAKYGIPTWMLNRRKDIKTGQDRHIIGSELLLTQKEDVDLLKRIKSWRGIRHALGLKVRGQRTRTTGRKGTTVGVRRKRK
ncbi:MAG: 30S ribosomal protein S13 [Candidatus Odinarchaeia archaeon]